MSSDNFDHIRHSAAHMLAAAVQKLYPGVKLGIGPVVEHGFYYDFQFPEGVTVSEDDLQTIEKAMRKIIAGNHAFVGRKVTVDEARTEEQDEPFKLQLIEELAQEGQDLTIYESGPFKDLCRGGHAGNTSEIPADGLKLHKVAGAYWRGNEKNPMLTRIYGLLFPTKEELETYLNQLEEAQKRDHRKLGVELDLFTFSDLVGPGLPLWTPKGTMLRNLLDDYVWQLRKPYGYEKVEIPHVTKKDLYEVSGHWNKFQDELFQIKTREDHLFAMKPMNCPHHTQIYARRSWSYRELPQRYANTTMCYRDEQSGELHGLSRVRSFTQDDAHVFCRTNQIKHEIQSIWNIVETFYMTAGFKLGVRLSFHDPDQSEKYLGSPELWKSAEKELQEIVTEMKVEPNIAIGEAAFYGPKIDFIAHDSLGREWQVATIQLDMNQPERFDLTCINEEGQKERIVMIHAAIMGSIERFLSIYIEHSAGVFPLWLSPIQVQFVPVSEKHVKGVENLVKDFQEKNIRIYIDRADETVGNKVRKAVGQKVPYIVVVGDKELDGGEWTIRLRGQEEQIKLSKEDFLHNVTKFIQEKTNTLS